MLKNYLLIAYKVLLRRKFFTFISLAGISLTLMILIVSSAFFDTVFGTIPPEKNAGRTLGVFRVDLVYEARGWSNFANPGLSFLTESINIFTLPGIENASVYTLPQRIETTYKNTVTTVQRKFTDSNFWEILDFTFIEGASFSESDVRNADFVAVINRSVRKKIFGSKNALGETITIDGQRYRVVGVVEDVSAIREIPFSEVWTPYTTMKAGSTFSDGLLGTFTGIVLANDRGSIPIIQEEYAKRVGRIPVEGDYDAIISTIIPYSEYRARRYAGQETQYPFLKTILPLILIMLMFITLPTVNLVNINLSRIIERSAEIGIRKSFGASSRELVGQFLVENLLLTFIGGAIGYVLSLASITCINHIQILPYARLFVNYRVFGYTFLVTVMFGLISGVYPAWKMSRLHPVEALRRIPL